MSARHGPRLLVRFLLLVGSLVLPGRAMAGGTTGEYWPEIDLWARLTPQFRLSSMIAVSRNVDTQYREGSFILQADYAWKRKGAPLVRQRLMDEAHAAVMNVFMLRGGYLAGKSLADDGAEYSERTGFLEFHPEDTPEGRGPHLQPTSGATSDSSVRNATSRGGSGTGFRRRRSTRPSEPRWSPTRRLKPHMTAAPRISTAFARSVELALPFHVVLPPRQTSPTTGGRRPWTFWR